MSGQSSEQMLEGLRCTDCPADNLRGSVLMSEYDVNAISPVRKRGTLGSRCSCPSLPTLSEGRSSQAPYHEDNPPTHLPQYHLSFVISHIL